MLSNLSDLKCVFGRVIGDTFGRILLFVWILSFVGVGYVVYMGGAEPDWQTNLAWFLNGSLTTLFICVAPTIAYQTELRCVVNTLHIIFSFALYAVAIYFYTFTTPLPLVLGVVLIMFVGDLIGKWSRGIPMEEI